jgi:Leucine-rich repeat (LRR) protein
MRCYIGGIYLGDASARSAVGESPGQRFMSPVTFESKAMRSAGQSRWMLWFTVRSVVCLAVIGLKVLPRLDADELPPLDQRIAALKVITMAGGNAWPDFEKLLAAGVTRDFNSPKHPFSFARFQGNGVTDEAIRALAAFPELERLSLSKSGITDDQLANLPLRNLKHLDLSDTQLTDEGVAKLASLDKLESLEMVRTNVTGPGFEALTALKRLQAVDLDETPVTDDGVACLARLPKLAVLDLNKTAVSDVALEHLRHNENLVSLGLYGTRVTDSGLASLAGVKKLAALRLDKTRVSDTGIEAVAHVPHMLELSLDGTRVTDASTTIIARWTDLRLLDLSRTAISEVGIKRLRGLKGLRYLWLRGTKASDASLQALAEMEQLEMLDLGDTLITDAGLSYLKPLSALERLNLSGTRVSGSRLEPLKALPNLTSVDVTGTEITAVDLIRALPQTHPNAQKIVAALDEKTELDFADQPFTDVIDYLRQRHDIEIQLDNRSLGDAGFATDTPITFKLKGITLRKTLQKLLGELDLAFAVRHEVLLIGAKPLPDEVPDFPLVPPGERLSPKLATAFMRKTELDFADQPLSDVIAFLAERHDIEIELDAKSLAAAGVGMDVPITRSVKGITLKSALELILGGLDLICVAEGDKVVVRAKPAE